MFKKYESIENSYRDEIVGKIRDHNFWKEEFVVQEKVHGANLSIWTNDGINFFCGKRTGSLEPNERFYNYQEILASVQEGLAGIFFDLKRENSSIGQVTVFGEIIGGNYPHKEIKRNGRAIRIQKGIFYSPGNQFYGFDIMIDREEFLDVDSTNRLFEKHRLLHAVTLYRGDIETCLNYPNAFDSTIPGILGLPKIEPNICEGIIIRPAKVLRFSNGKRVILKSKNDLWSERIVSNSKKMIKSPNSNTTELRKTISDYVTTNRLNNVLSKVGEPTNSNFSEILRMFSKDVIEDFTKDYEEEFGLLEKKEQKMVTKSINKKVVEMVKKICT